MSGCARSSRSVLRPRRAGRRRPMARTTRAEGPSRRELLLASGAAVAAAGLVACRTTRTPRPSLRLDAVRQRMAARVEAGEFPGAVWLIARGDEVVADAIGVTSIGGNAPMRRDTIFRIASMTKPITAMAVMIDRKSNRL